MLRLRETLCAEEVTEPDEAHVLHDMLTVLLGYLDRARALSVKGDSERCDLYVRAAREQAQCIVSRLTRGLGS